MFVSLDDFRALRNQLVDRGYQFATVEDPAQKTVSVTFDDGYRNNLLFRELSEEFGIPYVVFVSVYYALSGNDYPWMVQGELAYEEMHKVDYVELERNGKLASTGSRVDPMNHPMDLDGLKKLLEDQHAELGCHGYFHQPLSKKFDHYLADEQEMAMSALGENLGLTPRYFALANGQYTKSVISRLLQGFQKVFTIEGMPYSTGDKLIHRMSLINPNIGGPLISQIDRSLVPLRRIKRGFWTRKRLLI